MKVTVAGGGIVGLTCAWWLVEAGHDVRVYDPRPGQGATFAAAGMVAPAGEAWFGEEPLLRLGLASAALWPDFAQRLGVRFERTGTVLAGRDSSDVAVLQRSVELLRSLGQTVGMAAEPTLSDRICGTAFLPDDGVVNPREVTAALLRLLGDRVVRTVAPDADLLLCCTGADAHPVIHRVRGEILRVRADDPPSHVIRGLVHGDPVYVVPRGHGELVIGATSESHPGPPVVTVGGIARLLNSARSLLPSLETAEVLEALARDRPCTPDNGPLVGFLSDREVIAAGHYRGGVLLAPITAAAVLALIEGGEPPPEIRPFHPNRFRQETLLV
ncbi:MAG TPA: FAD-dependent oxidoreductase [Nocardioidaceae bacterium]|nr:FAD-dependent oxidoreductase [Nocardioidaceae bacterium]